MFWDTFVFNEGGNKLLHKVLAKYVGMGRIFRFYGIKNRGAKKLVGVKVCLTFGDERLPLSKMEDPIGF